MQVSPSWGPHSADAVESQLLGHRLHQHGLCCVIASLGCIEWSDVIVICGHIIRSRLCCGATRVKSSGDLSRYSNKIVQEYDVAITSLPHIMAGVGISHCQSMCAITYKFAWRYERWTTLAIETKLLQQVYRATSFFSVGGRLAAAAVASAIRDEGKGGRIMRPVS